MRRNRATGLVQSVRDRLRNKAGATGRPFAEVVELYTVERFLHRLGSSAHRDRFVLKGAQLLRHWIGSHSRPTRDVDLYRPADVTSEVLREELTDILTSAVEEDAVDFDLQTLTLEPIRNQSDVAGLRAKLVAYLGRTQIRFQIDVGLGDTVFPPPQKLVIDGFLDLPVASVRAYTPYSSVAEKLEAIVMLGSANSRMKDYYDLMALPAALDFDGPTLVESVWRTFDRRSTVFPPGVPDGLTTAFGRKKAAQAQWRAFLRRGRITGSPEDFHTVVGEVSRFLLPVVEAARDEGVDLGSWPAGGPWEGAAS